MPLIELTFEELSKLERVLAGESEDIDDDGEPVFYECDPELKSIYDKVSPVLEQLKRQRKAALKED